MEPNFLVTGIVALQEVYVHDESVEYFARLSMYVRPENDKNISSRREVELEVPISKNQYDSLKQQISSSPADYPSIKIKGKLELILDEGF